MFPEPPPSLEFTCLWCCLLRFCLSLGGVVQSVLASSEAEPLDAPGAGVTGYSKPYDVDTQKPNLDFFC